MAFQPVPTYTDPVEVDEKTGKSSFSPTWLSWFLTLTSGGLSNTIQHNSLLGLQGGQTGQYYHLTALQLSKVPFRNLIAPTSIALTGSPFSYRNVDGYDEDLIVVGTGTSLLEFSRDGVIYYPLGATQGMFHLSPQDYIRVTYTATPTITKVPR